VTREYPDRPIVGVGAVILVSSGDATRIGWTLPAPEVGVVLVKRKFEPLAGQWSLPGGAVEVGETLEAAIVREVAEETGLSVAIASMIDVFDRILLDPQGRAQYHFVLVDYVCRPTGGTLRAGSDVADAIVADPDDLGRYDLTEKTIEVIRRSFDVSNLRGQP
jgi:8-oxo-dGTP diphosphatase